MLWNPISCVLWPLGNFICKYVVLWFNCRDIHLFFSYNSIYHLYSITSLDVVFSQLQCALCQWDLTHFYTEEKAKAVRIIFSCKHTCNLLYTQNKVKFIFGNFERVGWFKWCVICIHLIHVGYFMLLGWKICAISVWWVCMDHTSQHGSWICAWHYSCRFAW